MTHDKNNKIANDGFLHLSGIYYMTDTQKKFLSQIIKTVLKDGNITHIRLEGLSGLGEHDE